MVNTEQIGNRLIVSFGLNEKDRFNLIREHNKDAFTIKEIFVNNGYCLELTPIRIL